jgi:hypothetical protein
MTMPRPPFRSAARLWSLWARPRPEIGAAPLPAPRLPAVLPRWDDICVAVLWLAQQRSELGWRQMDGSHRPISQAESGRVRPWQAKLCWRCWGLAARGGNGALAVPAAHLEVAGDGGCAVCCGGSAGCGNGAGRYRRADGTVGRDRGCRCGRGCGPIRGRLRCGAGEIWPQGPDRGSIDARRGATQSDVSPSARSGLAVLSPLASGRGLVDRQ